MRYLRAERSRYEAKGYVKRDRKRKGRGGRGPILPIAGLVALAVLVTIGLRRPSLEKPKPAQGKQRAVEVEEAAASLPEALSETEPELEDPILRLNNRAAQLSAAGDFAGAAKLLDQALARSPSDEALQRNLQAVLINWGYASLRAEDFSSAISRFIKAQALGDRVEIERGLGYSYFRQGRLELARAALEAAIALDPADEESLVTLGQTLLKLRDHAGALEAFERALALGSTYPGVSRAVEKLRRDAQTERTYTRLESSHFTIKFEGRENVLAGRTILNGLEEAYRTVGARFGHYPTRRLEAVLYTDQVFDEVINSPGWSGAIFDGRIKIPARGITRGSERLQRTLRHEYAHSVILELTQGKVPAWLNEGLAQLCEGEGDRGRGEYLRRVLRAGELLPLGELERPFIHLGGERAKLAYAQAYFAALYLTESKGRHNVARLLKALGTGDDFARVFEQTMHLSYADFQEGFFDHLQRRFGS